MGVNGLWEVLEPCRSTQSIIKWSGKTIAVDMSIWMHAGQNIKNVDHEHWYLRTIFQRVNKLTKHGVKIIAVLDGNVQEIKNPAYMRRYGTGVESCNINHLPRSELYERSEIVRMLLTSMGIPVIRAPAEAEAECAMLEMAGIAHATQSRDGDAFLFGSRTVIKEIRTADSQIHEGFEVYTLENCQNHLSNCTSICNLNLSRQKLISLAFLSRCDYGDGIKDVGVRTALKILQGLDDNQLFPFLNTLCQQTPFSIPELGRKSVHCSKCRHAGSKRGHEEFGCFMCCTIPGSPCKIKNNIKCTCDYHKNEKQVKLLLQREKIREKVSREYSEFPPRRELEGYVNPVVTIVSTPFDTGVDMKKLRHLLAERNCFVREKIHEKALEYAISWYLANNFEVEDTLNVSPTFIKTLKRYNSMHVSVRWWEIESNIKFEVTYDISFLKNTSLKASLLQFEKEISASKQNRMEDMKSNRKITGMFPVREKHMSKALTNSPEKNISVKPSTDFFRNKGRPKSALNHVKHETIARKRAKRVISVVKSNNRKITDMFPIMKKRKNQKADK